MPAAPPNTPANGMASPQQDSSPLRPSISSATKEVMLLTSSSSRAHVAIHAAAQGRAVNLPLSGSPAVTPFDLNQTAVHALSETANSHQQRQ